jgi:hypothetical protein
VDRIRDYGADIQYAGMAYTIGDCRFDIESGSSENGDWLRYLVIRAWPITSTVEERRSDPRYVWDFGGRPGVRYPDGVMRRVGTNGHVYVFFGNELRVMRVETSEREAVRGLRQSGSFEGMWAYLEQFRVAE